MLATAKTAVTNYIKTNTSNSKKSIQALPPSNE